MPATSVKIGGASGYWGDAAFATPQLLKAGAVDYLVYDYLAEITMSILARARAKDPDQGYAVDFVTAVLRPNIKQIAAQGIKVVANAGGVNPHACAAAARKVIAEAGVDLKVGVVTGDDLIGQKDAFSQGAVTEMFSGEEFPDPAKIASMNAYLGGFPIAEALSRGADIVITGRCVDSAVTLGVCIHEFGWTVDDWDELAGGSLAGHILECGPQTTGGNFTDWRDVGEPIDSIGYPIAEVTRDGAFTCTKPEGTGGLVSVGTVAEQMVYEIGDPQAYILPDVTCDFSTATITQEGANKVRVAGATGHPASNTYKVCSTYGDGFRGGHMVSFYGFEAEEKARVFADAIFVRARNMLRYMNLGDFTETSVEILGAESQFGAARQIEDPREVVVKFAAKHPDAKGIGVLLKEMNGMGLATPPGLSIFAGARPKPSPVLRLFSFLYPKDQVPIIVDVEGEAQTHSAASGQASSPAIERPAAPDAVSPQDGWREVPLIELAWGRSGDKGNKANIGIIARKPEYLPYIWAALTEESVADYFAHFLEGDVQRFLLPGTDAINFLLDEVLGGGGIASLRNDAQGKGYAQLLLSHPIPIPADLM